MGRARLLPEVAGQEPTPLKAGEPGPQPLPRPCIHLGPRPFCRPVVFDVCLEERLTGAISVCSSRGGWRASFACL